jgi:hypothetical protein
MNYAINSSASNKPPSLGIFPRMILDKEDIEEDVDCANWFDVP